MPKFVALLRGVNVGKAKRVPMAELRLLLEELGYTNVATLLNSGNAVFDVPKSSATKGAAANLASAIGAAIVSRFGFEAAVVVKSAKELAAIVAENPIEAEPAEHPRLLAIFAQDPKSLAALKAVEPLVVRPERLVIGNSAAYLHCARGILESKAGAALLGKPGRFATTRNWATVLKLLKIVEAEG